MLRLRVLLLFALVAAVPSTVVAQGACPTPCVGPARGTVVLAGGGVLDRSTMRAFIDLAGGPSALIVVIPTASAGPWFDESWSGLEPLRAAGARNLEVLHTRDRNEADTEAFTAALRSAGGVWIPGGRQGRLVDAYLGTRTHHELDRLLARGGVVGGSSAGASIMASYLVRGGVETNEVLMAPGYEEGFGFLRNAAVDQHLITRERLGDLPIVLDEHPQLLGLGIDEGTALVVQGDHAEVIGRSRVAVYDPSGPASITYPFGPTLWLDPGDAFDLGARAVVHRAEAQKGGAPGPSASSPW